MTQMAENDLRGSMSEKLTKNRTLDTSGLSSKAVIQMNGINKWFGQFHVLRDIDLTVFRGERIVI